MLVVWEVEVFLGNFSRKDIRLEEEEDFKVVHKEDVNFKVISLKLTLAGDTCASLDQEKLDQYQG